MPDPTIKPFHVPAYKKTQYRNTSYPLPNLMHISEALAKFIRTEKNEWTYLAHTRREGDRYIKQLASLYELYTNKNGRVKTFYKNKPEKSGSSASSRPSEHNESNDDDASAKESTKPIRKITLSDTQQSEIQTLLEKYKRRFHNDISHVNPKLQREKSAKQKLKKQRRAERKKAEGLETQTKEKTTVENEELEKSQKKAKKQKKKTVDMDASKQNQKHKKQKKEKKTL